MNGSVRVIIVALAVALGPARAAIAADAAGPALDVRIDVRAAAFGIYVRAARAVATELYAAANVRLVFHDRPEPNASVRQLTIVVVPSSGEMDALMGPHQVLARVVQSGVRAYVHYDRVVAFARATGIEPGQLLGEVIAHEICHLTGHGHSDSGLMAPSIDPRRGQRLSFTHEDADALRSRLAPAPAAVAAIDRGIADDSQ